VGSESPVNAMPSTHASMPRAGHTLAVWSALVLSVGVTACDSEEFIDKPIGRDAAVQLPSTPDEEPATGTAELRCRPARASEPLPAREAVVGEGGAGSAGSAIYIADLFAEFKTQCGNCHTDGRNSGGLDVKPSTFAEKMTASVLARIQSDNPKDVMPPATPGQPQRFSEREADDPVVVLAQHLAQWQAEGKPEVLYPRSTAGGDGPSAAGVYRPTPSVARTMTNLGNCIPDAKPESNAAAMERIATMDRLFASMRSFADLPKKLSETDLNSLDSEALAEQNVYAYAPTYTLWADNAKKIRYVRVPQGTSIQFDGEAQTFTLPENTRIYKVFTKRVTDIHGNVRYRKLETRLIVTRQDPEPEQGKDYVPAALFATYKWNEEETEATLLEGPYRDGTGFADHIFNVTIDEQIEDKVLRESGDDLAKMLELGAKRTYALPGSDRCIHCHMGAPGRDFILGFTPLQIHRRPLGEGGVIEAADEHELDQLARLIRYGLITGIKSASEIVPLEDSQPGRAPRNAHELAAQGYIYGNCAHCHNPRGFPSLREKSLSDALNFEPGDKGGVFQFPLDSYSPRTFRGPNQDIRVPYITPSLYDHPLALLANRDADSVKRQGLKWIEEISDTPEGEPLADTIPNLDQLPLYRGRPLLAPWRSLIYRNVDAPFSYEDGATIYPHMPMDTPGYDCRARRLLGNWMASIPSKVLSNLPADLGEMSDTADQPYVEVGSGDPDYVRYLEQASIRVARFQNGERYNDCPSPDLDVAAPEVSEGLSIVPKSQTTIIEGADGAPAEQYALLSPARPHYPATDLHDDLNWVIRRNDWYKVLVEAGKDEAKAQLDSSTARASAFAIETARSLKLTGDLRKTLLGDVPFGLWENKPACATQLAKQPKVGSYKPETRPSWMDLVKPPADAPVYVTSPGAQVFTTVCAKCHGPDATGTSALAATIADLTGGLTRVANLRDGLFGPQGSAGKNASTEFARAAGKLDGNAEEWVARYLAWMGLGGTNAAIPRTVLSQIGSAKVVGAARKGSLGAIDAKSAANMLGVVTEACKRFLPETQDVVFDPLHGRPQRARKEPGLELSQRLQFALEDHALIASNGDAALWELICHLDNPAPLKALRVDTRSTPPRLYASRTHDENRKQVEHYAYVYKRSNYPASAPVGDQHGNVVSGISAENTAPWCVVVSRDPSENAAETRALAEIEKALGRALPRCPTEFLDDFTSATTNELTLEEGEKWAMRGAANAGLAVFYYLEALAKGELKPQPSFDKCEEL
jgi:mono/diheme cytochrome c family protein